MPPVHKLKLLLLGRQQFSFFLLLCLSVFCHSISIWVSDIFFFLLYMSLQYTCFTLRVIVHLRYKSSTSQVSIVLSIYCYASIVMHLLLFIYCCASIVMHLLLCNCYASSSFFSLFCSGRSATKEVEKPRYKDKSPSPTKPMSVRYFHLLLHFSAFKLYTGFSI